MYLLKALVQTSHGVSAQEMFVELKTHQLVGQHLITYSTATGMIIKETVENPRKMAKTGLMKTADSEIVSTV